jgi:hypothetical protein
MKIAALLVAIAMCGCSSSGADCTSLCNAAQQGNCTSIKGNCASFCSALGVVNSEASCSSQYSAYESCLGSPSTVCTTSCGSQQTALQDCVTPYCVAHSSEASCVTLASSF